MEPTNQPPRRPSHNPQDLRKQARQAYETGRFCTALRILLWIVPVVALTTCTCGPTNLWHFAQGTALAGLCVWLRWRGLAAARAVYPGLIVGTIIAFVPTMLDTAGCAVLPRPGWEVLGACFAAGGLGGLALLLSHDSGAKRPFVFWGATVTLATATLGCSAAGLGAVLGVAVGLAISSAPALLAPKPA